MNAYLKRFLQSKSAEHIVGLFSHYNNAAKEITESYGILEAAKKWFPQLSSSVVVVVGDGGSPRTGSLFAYFTKAEVRSIDPNMNLAFWHAHYTRQAIAGTRPERLRVDACRIEDIVIDCDGKFCLAVWPHSHAPLGGLRLSNSTGRGDIVLPCCYPISKEWMRRPHITYDDYSIESPKRTIHVWQDSPKSKEKAK